MRDKLLDENCEHILIEDFLEGIEVSAFALCDGDSFSFLGTACDHKRLRDGDTGPNTGGMGVFSPASIFTAEDELWINENVFAPILSTMKKEGTPFSGILFAGLMKNKNDWSVLEFNVRFGDPETQALLPLIDEDLYPWFEASAAGNINELQNRLGQIGPKKSKLVGVHIVMAAYGYPGTEGIKVRSGDKIQFDEKFKLNNWDHLFFAGVDRIGADFVTKGGRVLGITSLSENYAEASKKAYELISQIHFEGAQYRHDIASGQV
jgi:phosphoribosylamine--glycine ligase